MSSCPNINSKEWKAAVDAVGGFEAMRDFMEHDTIRSVDDIRLSKPELFRDITSLSVKPGVEEIFNSNPELANQVYEALGFNKAKKTEFTTDEAQSIVDQWKANAVNLRGEKPSGSELNDLDNAANALLKKLLSLKGEKYTKAPTKATLINDLFDRTKDKQVDLSEDSPVSNLLNLATRFFNKELYDDDITPQQKQQALQVYSAYLDTIFPDSKMKDIVYHGSGYTFDTFKSKDDTFIFFTKSKDYASVYAEKGFEDLLYLKPYLEERIKKYNFLSESVYGDPANIYDAYRFYDEFLPNLINIGKYSAEKIADLISNAKDVMAIHQLYTHPDFEREYIRDSGDEDIAGAEYDFYYRNMPAEERERIDYLEDQKLADDAFRYEKTVEEVKRRLKKYLRKETKELSKEGLFSVNKTLKETDPQKNIYYSVLNIQNPQYADFEVSHETIKENLSQIDKSKDSLIGEEGELKAKLSSGTKWFKGQESISVKSPEQIHILGGQKDIESFKRFVSNKEVSFYRNTSDQNNTAEEFLLDNPQILNEEEQSNTKATEIINKLVDKLSTQLGIEASVISEEEALEMLSNAGKAYKGEAGFFYNGKVYLVKNKFNTEIAFHEFAHPLIKAIMMQNRELFLSLYDKLKNTPEGYALIEGVKRAYPEYAEGSDSFIEEVLVFALSKKADNIYNNSSESSGFGKFIKDLLYAIKQIIRKIFKGSKIRIENLDVNTTIDELANMLVSDSFVINTDVVTQSDVVSYVRDVRQEMINDLASIEMKELAMLSKEFHTLVKQQKGFITNKNYRDIAGVLKDKMDRGDLDEILANLRAYQTEGERIFPTEELKKKYMDSHAAAILNSFLRFDSASVRILDQFIEIADNVDDKKNLVKAYYLNRVIKDWSKFLASAKSQLFDTGKFSAGHPLMDIINRIESRLERTKKYSDSIYTQGVSELLIDQLTPLAESIDKHYEKILEVYRNKGASQDIIDLYIAEYEAVRLTPEKITQLLKGELGDAHALNSYLEGYMYNQDPIVLGFAGYVKDKFLSMNSLIHDKYYDFINDIEDLVNKAGYKSAYSRMHMGKDFLFLDSEELDQSGNAVKQVWRFRGPYKNYKSKLKQLRKNLEDAKKALHDEGSTENRANYISALGDLETFKAKYMHRPYTDEYYKLDEMFLDDVGREAYSRREEILSKIRNINSSAIDPEELLKNMDECKVYWRELKQLKSVYYPDGTPKDPDSMDYKVAIRLQEHSNLSNKYHEWVLRKGAFENSYLNYLRSLEDKGIKPDSDEYQEEKEKWLKNNTVTKLNSLFYKERAEIFAELNKLGADDPAQKRISEIYSLINNIISSYKDENFHPIGSEMPLELLEKVKKLEDELLELQESSIKPQRLTSLEWKTYVFYKEKVRAYESGLGDPPTAEETNVYNAIRNVLKGGMLTDEQLDNYEKRKALFQRLADLQKKEVTQDYVDAVNDFITNSPEALDYIKKELKISEFTKADIELLYLYQHLTELKRINPSYTYKKADGTEVTVSFSKWFSDNHIRREYDEGETEYYSPTKAWTHSRPVSSKYYEQTDILNDESEYTKEDFDLYTSYKEKIQNGTLPTREEKLAYGKVVKEALPGVPSIQYKYRVVRDSYTDENGNEIKLKTPRITMLECIRTGIGIENATIDSKGEWLPRYNNADKTYVNEMYEEMRNSSPDKFNLLQALIKHHLEFQEELPYDSRLDLDAPRFRATQYEVTTKTGLKETLKENRVSAFFKNLKQFFTRRSDDFEQGLNAQEREIFVKADLFDDDYAKIPIAGLYDIETDLVSMDLITGMTRYMQSAVRQKTLIDMLPVARSIQSLVQTPPYIKKKVSSENEQDPAKNMGFLGRLMSSISSPITGKGVNIRAQAINAFIEREFEGKTITGFGSQSAVLEKVTGGLMNLSSKMFFAFNIPSALKNSMGARFQSMIEASAGNNFNWTDYTKGTIWANGVTAEISMQVYKFGKKSLNYQLVEMMDPSQGRFESGVKTGRGISQSAVSDVMDLSFMTNVRKWTELNTVLSVFGAMLKKELVEIVDDNGVVSKITYDKAWEVVDGKIQLKKGISEDYAKGGKKFNSFVKKVHGVNIKLNGAYAQFEQPMAARFLLYRMIMFLKKYFTPMFMNRFQAKVMRTSKGLMLVPRYDGNTDTVVMGYWVEFFRALSRFFTVYKFNYKNLTQSEAESSRKAMTEIGLLAILNIFIIGFMFDWDDDDEERFAKLREKSGALPSFMTSENNKPFHLGGWISNHLLNLSLQLEAENDSFIPLPGMGLKDYANILTINSIALESSIGRYVDLTTQLYNLAEYAITGNDRAIYQKEAGPYEWQEQGDAKFWNHLGKMFSFTGKTVDPVLDIKGLSSRENR